MTAATRRLDSKVSLVRVRVLLHQSAFFNEWRLMLVDAKFCLQSEQCQSGYTKTQTASNLSGVPKVKEMKQDREGSVALRQSEERASHQRLERGAMRLRKEADKEAQEGANRRASV